MEPESQSQALLMELEPPILRNSDRPRTKHRRRRRSSARFLRLTGRLLEDINEEEDEEENIAESEQNLGDMYKRAIRMNAENRINASNSWNLRLIENIDKFLGEDPEESESPASSRAASPILIDGNGSPDTAVDAGPNTDGGGQKRGKNKEKRVNFTKASCTLDASVKIYSYRVDDVHLTSYKVLANLNRTDNNESAKKNSKQSKDVGSAQTQGEGGDHEGEGDDLAKNHEEGPSKPSSKNTGTLETNAANLNMNKLDSAFDIDPLFHKMSKTFDEGGAKGLLLVNLGVGDKGCNIVFDSKAECEEEEPEKPEDNLADTNDKRKEGMIDISSLVGKLDSMGGMHHIESLKLVPQLASLRDQYAQLKEEGFVEDVIRSSRRYASTQEEEHEADMSIHQEAIERSRASQAGLGRSFVTQDDDDDDGAPQFAPDDFGGGDDDDDDAGFDQFIALDENVARFSVISFQDSFASGTPRNHANEKSQAGVLLDAICSGNVLVAGQYEYFDTQALETSMAGNLWAGSAHWKRTEPARRRQEKAKPKATTKKSKAKASSCVDLTARPILKDILRKPPKSKRGANPLQLSKAMVTKYSRESNLLPPDSGMGVEKLAGLFLRPNTVVQPSNEKPSAKSKTVCFDGAVETFGTGFDDGVDDSFGGNDDGPGFAFGDADDDNENDFVMEELKGVRKIDTKNVQVGYATIAKKVDVRRLKRDLWTEIESSIIPSTRQAKPDESSDEEDPLVTPDKTLRVDGLSFQNTVQEMEQFKTQMDVTLPFYFICVLHLANEKGLRLESSGLSDFVIYNEQDITSPSI